MKRPVQYADQLWDAKGNVTTTLVFESLHTTLYFALQLSPKISPNAALLRKVKFQHHQEILNMVRKVTLQHQLYSRVLYSQLHYSELFYSQSLHSELLITKVRRAEVFHSNFLSQSYWKDVSPNIWRVNALAAMAVMPSNLRHLPPVQGLAWPRCMGWSLSGMSPTSQIWVAQLDSVCLRSSPNSEASFHPKLWRRSGS